MLQICVRFALTKKIMKRILGRETLIDRPPGFAQSSEENGEPGTALGSGEGSSWIVLWAMPS